MNQQLSSAQQEALLTVCLMAAFADGGKTELERAELRRITESFPDLASSPAVLYQRVLLQQIPIGTAVMPLDTPALRNAAYEMAVCVADADDAINPAEQDFLNRLRSELRLDPEAAAAFEKQAQAIALAPVTAVPPVINAPPVTSAANAPQDQLDSSILNYSILNGALELLPESIATMAIIPLQMKMVHSIGCHYGYPLDRGHIREFAATLGVGMTSQVVEGYARKLLKGFLGGLGGGMLKGVAGQLTSSAFSFATTYALGNVAKAYYAGGRKMSAVQLKELFGNLSREGQSLHSRLIPQIQERAKNVNIGSLMPMITGRQS